MSDGSPQLRYYPGRWSVLKPSPSNENHLAFGAWLLVCAVMSQVYHLYYLSIPLAIAAIVWNGSILRELL